MVKSKEFLKVESSKLEICVNNKSTAMYLIKKFMIYIK